MRDIPADRPVEGGVPLPAGSPPMLSVIGRKHAGKTTTLVRLAAELTRRGARVMTLKHGSHTFSLDPEGTDTYRHYHEGNVERVAMASPDKFALVMRWTEELSPEAIAARFFPDADLVLCEGFKRSSLDKVEVFRRAAHPAPLWEPGLDNASAWRAMVSDTPVEGFPGTQFDFGDPTWLTALADWVAAAYLKGVR